MDAEPTSADPRAAGPGAVDLTTADRGVVDPAAWHGVLRRVIDGSHLATADDLTPLLDKATAPLGVSVRLYVVDLAQRLLHPVAGGPELPVDSSEAGRAYRDLEIIGAPSPSPSPSRLWLPLLNGTERLGVVRVDLPEGADPADTELRAHCWTLAGLAGHLVQSKQHYSDLFHVLRRTKQLTVASELLWQMLPPQTFASERVVVTAAMEPYDEVGGDGYDYAVSADRAYVALIDAMGHDMSAGLTTTVALAATRNARRGGLGLVEAAELADRSITSQNSIGRLSFATALLAGLDLHTGVLEYLNAGHPPPVLFRDGRAVGQLEGALRTPLGLGHLEQAPVRPATARLRPGDRVLLLTDGIVEARSPSGELFGLDRLVGLVEEHEAAGMPAPETLRRVTRAVLEHQRGRLQDDATLLLLEWSPDRAHVLLPSSV
ncbi:PP2C family protein-serine/threonine phosphatase [Saccharothrix xinjiangensis]|uniref:PP2C family protein-serine/threonine phosphatase n=1 Tax=Saccharothrix xinjiangensis TaxID=204798 RepID=A0ABV9Y4B7_9PSEU